MHDTLRAELRSNAAALAPFLPLIYVAWADGELEADEIDDLRSRCRESLEGEGPSALDRWLDPRRPPTPSELAALLTEIRVAAEPLPRDTRMSLAELGRELALRAGREIRPDESRALVEIETALGLEARPLLPRLLAVQSGSGADPARSASRRQATFQSIAALLEGAPSPARRRVLELLQSPAFAFLPPDTPREAHRAQVLAWCRALADEGIGALGLSPEDGGAGDSAAFLAVFEVLAFHDLSLWVKFGVQFGLFAGSIRELGTESHHRRYLGPAGRLELPGCFAMTETGHGSNVAELETTATFDPATDEFVLETPGEEARKDYIGGAARDARLAVVFAQLETLGEPHGVHAFVVPIRRVDGSAEAGVRLEDCGEKLGLNGVDNGRIWFRGVRVPRQNLLDRFASVAADGTYSSPITGDAKRFFVTLGTLVGGRVNVGIAAVSAAKKALTIAVRYGASRRQFATVPILDYLTHQRRLLPRLATTYALHFALRSLAARFVTLPSDDRRDFEASAAGLKAWSTWHSTETIQTCREACGGAGYMAENQFAALKADTDVFTTFEGDNTVLCQLLAKGLLTGFRQQYANGTLLGMARYLGARIAGAASDLADFNVVTVHTTDSDHLRGREFQVEALRWREDRLLRTLARRLKRRIDEGLEGFLALQACGDHALALANAHVERSVFESFCAAIDGSGGTVPEGEAGHLLELLRSLFGLARIHGDIGWFLEHGVVSPGKARAVRREVNRLCGELRPHAVGLVDAFGIPEGLLGAPIARR